jgi:predicted nucleic acid-binding protein
MVHKAVLLDTSFFLRFLNETDPLFSNADNYYKYFLKKDIDLIISTISIAEYCVGGNVNELPLKNLKILPFNIEHAKRTGEFARIVFEKRETLKIRERNIIPNDSKLFAQADVENNISYYITSDSNSLKIFNIIKETTNPKFQFIDLNISCSEIFGELEFKE